MAHRKLAPDARIERALQVLQNLDGSGTAAAITLRLSNPNDPRFGLPPCQKDEEASSIFIDVIKATHETGLADRLRFACLQALRGAALTDHPDPDLIGELCYLAAAMDAAESIDFLAGIVARKDAGSLFMSNREDVRLRALRSLVGLLASNPDRAITSIKSTLEALLKEDPRYQMLALTGLVGLWPEQRESFLHMLPNGKVDERRLKISLDLAGFSARTQPATGL